MGLVKVGSLKQSLNEKSESASTALLKVAGGIPPSIQYKGNCVDFE